MLDGLTFNLRLAEVADIRSRIEVFKTGVSSDPAQAGSIPVRLHEPGRVRTVGATKYGWMHVRDSTRIAPPPCPASLELLGGSVGHGALDLRRTPASNLTGRRRRGIPGSPTFLDHGHQQAVRAVVSAGAPASQRVRGRLGREPAGRADDDRERPALAHRRRTRRSGSSRTIPRPARSCGPPGARWPPHARWRAATVSCRSSRYARTGRIGAGETTNLRWPRTRRSRSRWAPWLGRLLARCSRWLPSWPPPAPHRLARNPHRRDPELAGHRSSW